MKKNWLKILIVLLFPIFLFKCQQDKSGSNKTIDAVEEVSGLPDNE